MEKMGFDWRDLTQLVAIAVGVSVWTFSTFQTKQDAEDEKRATEKRFESVENDNRSMRSSMEGVAKDVSYIRGRLEPKQ